MKTFTAFIEWDPETKLYVGTVPGIPGAHTQGATLDELNRNLREVLELLAVPPLFQSIQVETLHDR